MHFQLLIQIVNSVDKFEIPWNDVCPLPKGLLTPTPSSVFLITLVKFLSVVNEKIIKASNYVKFFINKKTLYKLLKSGIPKFFYLI